MKIYRILPLLFLAALMAAVTPEVKSQNSTLVTTPYSMYGYGVIGDRATSMQRQMGGVGYAMNSGRQINAMNPASYASVDSLTFLWDMGGTLSFVHSKEGSLSENSMGGGLDYLTLQFPIGKHFGGSAGLIPYSSVGYSFGTEIEYGAHSNQGTGGINEAYLGFAGRLAGFSLGFNVSYNFGNIRNDVYSTPSSGGNTLFERMMEVRDWNINIGAQYTAKLNKANQVTLGLTYSPKKTMRGRTWVAIQELVQDSKADTLGYTNMKDKYYQPNTIGAGISYRHERTSRLLVELDYTWQDWSKAKYSPVLDTEDPTKVLFSGMQFKDRTKLAIGAEYVPKVRGSYLQRIAYRLGANMVNDYIQVDGNQIKEFNVSCGFGLPTPEGKTLINVGFEFKHRQGHPMALVKENYFNIMLGINFNELWFWQRKIK